MNAMTLDTITPTVTTRLEPQRLPAAGRGQFVVTVDIPAGCHIQSHLPSEPFLIPTTLELDEVTGVTFGSPVLPTPDTERFDWTPVKLDVYRGRVHIVVGVTLAPYPSVSNVTIVGRLRYQACTESACFPPEELSIAARLDVAPFPTIEPAELEDLAHHFAEHGPDDASDALAALLDIAGRWGVAPLHIAIASDGDQPDIARQRAIGRILVELSRAQDGPVQPGREDPFRASRSDVSEDARRARPARSG